MYSISPNINWNNRTLFSSVVNSDSTGANDVGYTTLILTGLLTTTVGLYTSAVGLVDHNGQWILSPKPRTLSPDLSISGVFNYPNYFFLTQPSNVVPIAYGLECESYKVCTGTSLTEAYSGIGKSAFIPTISNYLTGTELIVTRGLHVPYVSVTTATSTYIQSTEAVLNCGYIGTGVVGDYVYVESGPNAGTVYRITGQGSSYLGIAGSDLYLEGLTGSAIAVGNKVSIWQSKIITGENTNYYLVNQRNPLYPNSVSLVGTQAYCVSGTITAGNSVNGFKEYVIASTSITGQNGIQYGARLREGDYIVYTKNGTATLDTAQIAGYNTAGGIDTFFLKTGNSAVGQIDTTLPAIFLLSNNYLISKGPAPGGKYSTVLMSGFLPYNNSFVLRPSPTYTGVAYNGIYRAMHIEKVPQENITLDYSFNEYDSNVTSIGSRAHFHIGPIYHGNEVITAGISGCRATLYSPQSSALNSIKTWNIPTSYMVSTKSGSTQDGSYYDPTRGIFVLTYNAGIQFDQARTYTLDVEVVVNGQVIKRAISVPTQPPI